MSDLIGQLEVYYFTYGPLRKPFFMWSNMIGQLHVMITINYKTEIYLTRDKATATA